MPHKSIKNITRIIRKELIESIREKLSEIGVTDQSGKGWVCPVNQEIRDKILNYFDSNNLNQSLDSLTEQLAARLFNQMTSLYLLEKSGLLPTELYELFYKLEQEIPVVEKDLDSFNEILDIYQRKTALNLLDKQEDRLLTKFLLLQTLGYLEKILPSFFDLDLVTLFLPENSFNKEGWLPQLFSYLVNFNSEFPVDTYLLGELYQNFNNDRKNQIFKTLRSRKKISEETLSNATMIFTPEWIVKYLVENSLGRFWINVLIQKNPSLTEEILARKFEFKYYIPEKNNPTPDQPGLKETKLEEITFLDPAVGSGNILSYAFEVFLKFYLEEGYTKDKAVKLILSKNLYGLDINCENIKLSKLNLLIQAKTLNNQNFNIFTVGDCKLSSKLKHRNTNLEFLENTALLGSLLKVEKSDLQILKNEADEDNLLRALELLTRKYNVVVTNPPYFGSRFLGKSIDNYLKNHYQIIHKDLYSAFIEQALSLTAPNGYTGLIVQTSFLSIKTLKCLRENLIDTTSILSLLDIGRGIFGNDFGSAAFVLRKDGISDYTGNYFKLHDQMLKYYNPELLRDIFLKSLENPDFSFNFKEFDVDNPFEDNNGNAFKIKINYLKNQQKFLKFPDSKFVFWADQKLEDHFSNQKPLSHYANAKQGMATSDNERFLRFWYEVDFKDIKFNTKTKTEVKGKGYKWFPYNKGGSYRKWYGNNEYIINWANQGEELTQAVLKRYPYLTKPTYVIKNQQFYFRPSFSWSLVASNNTSFRYKEPGYLFDIAGMSIFAEDNLYYIGGLCNSVVSDRILEIINPTINYQCGDIARIPFILDKDKKTKIEKLVEENIALTKEDWDSFELSWDFKCHPLINGASCLEEAFKKWQQISETRFNQLKKNEETLNEIFISIYGLNSLSPKVLDENISVSKAELKKDIKSFLTYFLGCLFGRYSLDVDGLVFSGGDWDDNNYQIFKPIDIPVVPLTPTKIFENDIISHLERFLVAIFGPEKLEENLDFIASSFEFDQNSNSRDRIRNYFLNHFYKDYSHLTRKRPLYWNITSGKSNAFQAIVFYHRFNKKVYEEILNYLPVIMNNYENCIKDLNRKMESLTGKTQLRKIGLEVKKLNQKLEELNIFKNKIEKLIQTDLSFDLDDGIKQNYLKLQTVDGEIQNIFTDLHFEKQRKF